MIRKPLLSALFAASVLVLSALPAGAQGACLQPRQIQDAVASGQILSSDEVLRIAGVQPKDIVGALKVCDEGGQLRYLIPVLQGGDARTISLNATTGRP